MSKLPRHWENWELGTIQDLVAEDADEPGYFDFKEVLNSTDANTRSQWNASIAKAVCSMANTDSGYLIFGVKDRKSGGSKPEDRIVGIPLRDEHRKEFGEKVKSIQPNIRFDAIPSAIPLESDRSRGIYVVQVPLSPLRPHMIEGAFYVRSDGGFARHMQHHEVRDQMLLTEERLRQVSLVRLKLLQFRNQCVELQARAGTDLRDYYGRFETDGFEALLATICALLPTDQALLSTLLSIPPKAQALNRLLDLWHFDFGIGHQLRSGNQDELSAWASKIHDDAAYIALVCGNCEAWLGKRFGSLTLSPLILHPNLAVAENEG